MSDERNPSLGQLLLQTVEAAKKQTHVGCPGVVQAYYPATQTVDVQPLIYDSTTQEDGTVLPVVSQVIPNVPVACLGANGFRLTFPIVAGDTGWIAFADRSMDAWQSLGTGGPPPDERRHHVSDACFFPGVNPNTKPWTTPGASSLTVGADAGAQIVFRGATIELGSSDASPTTDFVALASLVLAQLSALVTTFNAHTHLSTSAPVGPVAPSGPAVPLATAPSSVGSAIVGCK